MLDIYIDRDILLETINRKIVAKKKQQEKSAIMSGQKDQISINPDEPLIFGNSINEKRKYKKENN